MCERGNGGERPRRQPFGTFLDNFSIAPYTTVRISGSVAGSAALSGLGCIENGFSSSCDRAGFGMFVGNSMSREPFYEEAWLLRAGPSTDPDAQLFHQGSFSLDIVNDTGETMDMPLWIGVGTQVFNALQDSPPPPVPEPSTGALALIGLAGLGLARAMRRDARARATPASCAPRPA